jgi:broad specificity phosphatase PhoE
MARAGHELYLVRHGETEWSLSGQHTGVTDLPLLPQGEEAARALQQRLAGHAFALALSSPRQRARETARLSGHGDVLELTEDLFELGYGDYEGRTTPEIREERPGWDIWKDGAPGGEPLAEAAARVDRVIERALAAEGDVIIFAHGHILRILGARWMGLGPEAASALGLGTASLCVLGFERERRVIWLWNDTTHVPR